MHYHNYLKHLELSKSMNYIVNQHGHFPHNPEPLPENLTEISEVVRKNKADVGFVVDPDVDSLAIVMKMEICLVKNIPW